MGDYVYFRFTGKLKKEFNEDIKRIVLEDGNETSWKHFGEKYEWAKPFTHNERDVPYPEEIPFMSMSAYNEDKNFNIEQSLNILFEEYEDEDDMKLIWQFACDPKWGEGIKEFLQFIAPKICEEYVAYVWNEYRSFPEISHYKEGKGILNENSFNDIDNYKRLLKQIDEVIEKTQLVDVKSSMLALKGIIKDEHK